MFQFLKKKKSAEHYFSVGAVYYVVQGSYNFQFLDGLFSDDSNGSDMFNDSVSFPVFIRPNLGTLTQSTHTILRSSLTFIYLKNLELMRMDETREVK